MAGASTLRDWILTIWDFLWNSVVRVLWLCGYATVATVGVAYLFIANDQGQDLLRISAERGLSLWNFLFFTGTAALALTVWYTARLLLGRRFPSYPLDPDKTRRGRKWLPRLFGGAVPLSIAIGFFLVETDRRIATWILAALYLLLAAFLVRFFIMRRQRFLADPGEMIDTRVTALLDRDRRLTWGTGIFSALLVVAFMVWPVGLPQLLGAPAIVVLGFAGIALFGGMVLTYAFLAAGQPGGTGLALVLAVLFGLVNDNHWVRLADSTQLAARPSPGAHYRAWSATRTKLGGEQALVILVTASGGGIRAAYWTASILASMESVPGFGDRLFAVSGVSGGSLGAATYAALKRRQLETGRPPEDILAQARQVLGQDFLSPVVAGLLFPDLVQRFLPAPIPAADRQRFLEKSWEAALGAAPNAFTNAFTALYDDGYAQRIPALLLNATVVDSGRRAIASNLDVGGFINTVDLLAPGYSTQRVKLSAAAGMSARFTYVSPAGALWRPAGTPEQPKDVKLRVVDGGYFENSGAATAMDLLNAMSAEDPTPDPILILIRNDPLAPAVCHRKGAEAKERLDAGPEGPAAGEFLNEVSAPIRALLNARSARGRLAEVAAARSVEAAGGAVVEISLAAVVQSRLRAATDEDRKRRLKEESIEPPLGWSLSEDMRQAMDTVLDRRSGGLDREFAILQAAIAGTLSPQDRCNAR